MDGSSFLPEGWSWDDAPAPGPAAAPAPTLQPAPPPDPGQKLLADAQAKYPFIAQHSPYVKINPRSNAGYAETFPSGETGDEQFPRPKEFPINGTGIEVYQPEKFGPDDLAAEFLHVDPKAHAARQEILGSLTPKQAAILKNQPDYTEGQGLTPAKRMENAVDSLLRGYTVGQWPKNAIAELGLTPQQVGVLDGLKQYMTGPKAVSNAPKADNGYLPEGWSWVEPTEQKPGQRLGQIAKDATVKGLKDALSSTKGGLQASIGGMEALRRPIDAQQAQAEAAFNDDTGKTPWPSTPQAPSTEAEKLLQTPLTEGYRDPGWWTAHLAHGLTSSSPTLGLGLGGGAAGGLLAGPPGALAGGIGGMAVGSALQEVAPAYQRARSEGLSHEQSVDRAMKETGIAAAFGAAMGAAPELKPFKSALGNALAEVFVKQPGLMAGQTAATNALEGKPVGQGVAESAVMGAAMGVPLAAHAALRPGVEGIKPGVDPQVDAWLREAESAQNTAQGKATRAEMDEFIRRKDATQAQQNTPRLSPPTVEQPQAGGENPPPAAPGVGAGAPEPSPAGSPAAPAAQPAEAVSAPPMAGHEAENEALRAAGWDDADISIMGAAERRKNLRDAGYEDHIAASPQAPVKVESEADIAPARARVDTDPTPAQLEAGNYRKGHVDFDGFPVSIENPKGSIRTGTDPDGNPYQSPAMPADYGYIKGARDNTGENVDVFLGPKPTGKVFVIDSHHPQTGAFDEPKAVLGAESLGEAARIFSSSYDKDGHQRIGGITEMTTDQFRDWLKSGAKQGQIIGAKEPENAVPLTALQPAPPEQEGAPNPPALVRPTAQGSAGAGGTRPAAEAPPAVSASGGNVSPEPIAGAGGVTPARKPAGGRPQSLVGFLKAMGGLKEQGGELGARNLEKLHKGLVNPKGVSLDHAREAAAEAGYLGPDTEHAVANTTIDDLLDAIGKHPTYSVHDEGRLQGAQNRRQEKEAKERHKEARQEIIENLAHHGVSTSESHIEDAAKIVAQEGERWDDALEIAAMRRIAEDAEQRAAFDQTTEQGHEPIPWERYEGPQDEEEIYAAATVGEGHPQPASAGAEVEGAKAGGDVREPAAAESRPVPAPEAGVAWGDAKPGDKLLEGSTLIKKGIRIKRDAKALAEAEGGRVILDGPEKWAVVKDKTPELTAGLTFEPATRVTPAQIKRDPWKEIHRGEYSVIGTREKPWAAVEGFGATPEEAKADALRQLQKSAPKKPEPTYEPGAEGKPQAVVPGAEKAPPKTLAEIKANAPLKKPGQQAPGGMFDEEATAPQLFDQKPEEKPEPPAAKKEWSLPPDEQYQWFLDRRSGDFKPLDQAKPGWLVGDAADRGAHWKVTRVEDGEVFGQRDLDPKSPLEKLGDEEEITGKHKITWDPGKPLNLFAEVGAGIRDSQTLFSGKTLGETTGPKAKGDISQIVEEAIAKSKGETIKPRKTPLQALTDHFLDPDAERFPTIVQARKFVREHGFTPAEGSPENKQIEELIEHAVVRAARQIVDMGRENDLGHSVIFDELKQLYESQPRLNSRTSASVAEQAYSTPAPLAYVASRLAGIDKSKTVLEPTAGNGMLLMEANPKKAIVNELNPTRAKALDEQGFSPMMGDAVLPGAFGPSAAKGVNVVIANPPFGAVKDQGGSKSFDVDGFKTTQIDHAIALNSLKAMEPDGRAVLILGGVKAESPAERAKGYQGAAKRRFFHTLMQNYRVADVFTVDGSLYERQGAGWPVDVVVIDGKGASDRKPLSAEPPPLLKTWGEVKEKLANVPGETGAVSRKRGEPAAGPAARPAEPAGTDGGAGADAIRGESAPLQPEPAQPAAVGPGSDRGQPGDEGHGGAVGHEPQPASGLRREPERVDYVPDTDRRRPVKANEAGQVSYSPASKKGVALGTLLPTNLRDATEGSLERVQKAQGQIDHYVANALGYKPEELGKYFSAEQVDAIGLAIDNVEKGAGMIVGDQTGIGKGRVVAAAIRYAHGKGMVPVFVTEKPDLYGDMWRDLNDIGWPQHLGRDINMFMTNAGLRVPLDEKAVEWAAAKEAAEERGEPAPPREGSFSAAQTSATAAKRLGEILAGTHKPDVIFTTYDQMNSVKGQETDRRRFLRQIAPKAFLILDEAHNAGGQGEETWDAGNKAEPRSKVFRQAVEAAGSVMYSSATFAKSPKVMDLFSRTDMAKAVEKPAELPLLIERGGVPLQQVLSSTLAKAGQYIRRERSFEGVTYEPELAPVDAKSYANFTEGLGTIFRFDKSFEEERAELAQAIAAELGAGNARDEGTGSGGASSINFASIMHNAVSQMILAIKAEAAGKRAVEALQAGEKPVIALSSTMETFISDFVEASGLKEGDAVPLTFQDVLNRYLDRTRRVTIKMPDDTKKHVMIPLADMSPEAQSGFRQAQNKLKSISMADLPISPIDKIRSEIQKAGFSVREVTGRSLMLDYAGETPMLTSRPSMETGSTGKRVSIKAFNDGSLDAIILNRSGSTGVSLHASAKFKDQRPRRMILVQADPNPDTHMQMLGRIHRTGQVELPRYTQLAADIPAETRPTAVLLKKMASLNANTTASRKSKFSSEGVDFMNKYGDQVAAATLREDAAANAKMGFPVSMDPKAKNENAMAKVTGRLTLLPPAEQAELIDKLTNNYKALIARLDAEGTNDLEAKSVDLQAKTLDSQLIKPATGPSPFQGEVRLERVSVKSQGRAMAPEEVVRAAADAAGFGPFPQTEFARDLHVVEDMSRQNVATMLQDVGKQFNNYVSELQKTLKGDARQKAITDAAGAHERFRRFANLAYPGNTVRISWGGDTMPAVVIGFDRTGKTKNPVALSGWTATFAVPDSARSLGVPLSQMYFTPEEKGEGAGTVIQPETQHTPEALRPMFEEARKEGREERYMFSGNILAAFDQTKGRGQIINHTMEDGSVRPAIFMSRAFQPADFFANRSVKFKTGAQVLTFLDKLPQGEATSTDSVVTVRKMQTYRPNYEFDLPAAKASGGKYFTDRGVRDAYDMWEKRGSRMRATVDKAVAEKILDAMMKADAVFETKENQDAAEAIVNAEPKEFAQAAPQGWEQADGLPRRSAEQNAALVREIEHIRDAVLPPGNHVTLQTLPSSNVRVSDASSVRSGGTPGAPNAVGLTKPTAHDAEVLIALAGQDPKQTAWHEFWHVAQHLGLATEKELAVLRSRAEQSRMRSFAEQTHGAAGARAMPQIELEGNAFGAYAAALDEGREPPRLHASSLRLFDRLYAFLRRLRNFVAGRGFQTTEDIISRFQKGGFKWRTPDISKSRLRADHPDTFTEGFASVEGSPDRRYFGEREGSLWDRLPRPDMSRLEENFLDLAAPVRDMAQDLNEGRRVPQNLDPYKAKRLMPGKTAAAEQDFHKFYVEPLVEHAKAAGLSRQDIAEWLYASHAPERNAEIDKINPDVQGMGSGITDEEAHRVKDRLTAEGKAGALKAVANDVAKIREFILRTWEESGLVSEETAERWRGQYRDYVPLQGFEDPSLHEEERRQTFPGGGMSIRGPEVREAYGRLSIPDDPLSTMVNMAYRAIDRAQKNQALQTAWRFFKSLPSEARDGVVSLDRGKQTRGIDPKTGMVRFEPESMWRMRRDAVPLKIGGQPHYMVFSDPRLAEAMMRVRAERLPAVLHQAGQLVNVAKSLWTHYNPEFVVRHFFMRYPVEAFANAGEDGVGAMFRAIKKGYPFSETTQAIFAHRGLDEAGRAALARKVANKTATPQEKLIHYYQEMRDAGGLMNFADFGGVDDVRKKFDTALATLQKNPLRASWAQVKAFHEAVNHFTSTLDNAQRLAAYVEQREKGVGKVDAAMAAREATIDFSLRGRFSNWLTLMWPFANTGAQTASRMVRAVRRSPNMRGVVAGAVALGAAVALYDYLMGGKGEDQEPYVEKIPDYLRRLNAAAVTPFKDEKGRPYFATWALPYNYAFPFTLGASMVEMSMRKFGPGKEKYSDILTNLLHSGLEAFLPVSQENTLIGKVTPEPFRPLLHVALNQTWTGAPLHADKEPWNEGVPPHLQGKKNLDKSLTGPLWKGAAAAGAKVGFEAYPEDYQEVLGYFTSAAERLANHVGATAKAVGAGQKPESADVPFLRAMAWGGDKSYEQADAKRFYDERREAYGAHNQLKDLQRRAKITGAAADRQAASDFAKANGPALAASEAFRTATGRIGQLHKQMEHIEAQTGLPEEQRQRQLDALRQQEIKIRDMTRMRVEKARESR